MPGPGTESGLSLGFDSYLLSLETKRVLLFTVSLCLCPPGPNSGIGNSSTWLTSRKPLSPGQFLVQLDCI